MFEKIRRYIFLNIVCFSRVAYSKDAFTIGIRIGKLGKTYKTLRPRAVKKYWSRDYARDIKKGC